MKSQDWSRGKELAVVDSGANYSVYNMHTAKSSEKSNKNIHIINNKDRHTVVYGNGTEATTNQQLNVTPNFKAVVMSDEHCPQNLLSIKTLTDNDCTATFKQNICIIDPPERTNYKSIIITRDYKTNLYHANLEEIHMMVVIVIFYLKT